jgi:hypothetical protein
MSDILIGLLAVAVGALIAARGYLAMRLIIPVWGAFTGFFVGAGIVGAVTGDGFLSTVVGWLVGLAVAMVFALLAYLYYELSVVIAMGAIGFSLGTAAMVALGVSWSWVIVLVGVLAAVFLAGIAIVGDLPMVILMVLSALAGASTVVFGLMLVFGVIDLGDLDSAATTQAVDDDWWWYAISILVAAVGIAAQFRAVESLTTTMRQQWAEDGGRQLRAE